MRRTGYPEQCALNGARAISGRGSAHTSDKDILCHRCASRQYQMAEVSIPPDVDRVGYDARFFVDTLASVDWQECYNPAHPLTRIEDMQYRLKLMTLMKDYGLIAGTESTEFWAAPALSYAEAVTSYAGLAVHPWG